jgi:hypothetical protein
MKYCIPLLIVLSLFGCSKDDIGPGAGTVHLVGSLQNSNMDGDKTASYWKDGVYTALTEAGIQSDAGSLYVDGSTVFIGGEIRVPNALPNSVTWRDGIETVIEGAFGTAMVVSRNSSTYRVWLSTTTGWSFDKNGASETIRDTAYSFAPLAMAVFDDDVYMSGYSSGRSSFDYSPPSHAQYWKNSQLIFRENKSSNALSIFPDQKDIYMAGYVYSIDPPWNIACYWKNGQLINLTDGSKPAIAKSIYVTEGHVFVAGTMDNQAVYWKDGELVSLTTQGTLSIANSIFVRGNDVHVGGSEHGFPAYWKNGTKQTIANQDKRGQIKVVVAGSN